MISTILVANLFTWYLNKFIVVLISFIKGVFRCQDQTKTRTFGNDLPFKY